MLEALPVVLIIGTALGFLAGIGVGGGSLLMVYLTLVLGISHPEARLMNLLFFLPSAIVASFFRWREGKLDFKKVLPAIITGCIAAGVCSLLSGSLDMEVLKKLFGGLLILTGLRELCHRQKKRENTPP